MKLAAKLKHHFRSVAVDTAYFSAWIGSLVLLKTLVLAHYRIGFVGWSKVLAGALVLGKVVRILGHIPFGAWVRARPAWVEVVLRTALYSIGLAVVMVLGDAFAGRHEHGGIVGALKAMRRDASFPHLLVNSICLAGAFLFYNVLAVLRCHLGGGGLFRLFLKPLPKEPMMPANPK